MKKYSLVFLLVGLAAFAFISFTWISVRTELREMHEHEVQETLTKP